MTETQLGYTLLPPRREHSPGYSGADVIFCEEPSRLHFDPKKMILAVVTATKDVETIIIRYPWQNSHYQTSAGAIHIEDAIGKELELFTFGGELSVQAGPDCTKCEIRSPAPILGNFADHSTGRLLAEETEIILAQERADFIEDEQVYDRRLASLDPLDLYYASLNTLLERFHHLPETTDGMNVRLVHTIRSEIEYLRTAPQYGRRFSANVKIADLFK